MKPAAASSALHTQAFRGFYMILPSKSGIVGEEEGGGGHSGLHFSREGVRRLSGTSNFRDRMVRRCRIASARGPPRHPGPHARLFTKDHLHDLPF